MTTKYDPELLQTIAAILRQDGLNAQYTPPDISITHNGNRYTITTDGEHITLHHNPKPIKIPLQDPKSFQTIKKLCEQTWPTHTTS